MPKIGGTKDPDLAMLRALAPTHLVVNVDENRREDVDAARAFVPNVIVTHPMAPVDNVAAVCDCSARSSTAARAAARSPTIRRRRSQASRTRCTAIAREPVLYLIWRKPWMTVSRDDVRQRVARARRLGHACPRQAARAIPALDDDDAAWRDAQRILLSTEPYAFRARDARELRERCGKPVALVDGEWTSWYGVRAIDGPRAPLARFAPSTDGTRIPDRDRPVVAVALAGGGVAGQESGHAAEVPG